MAAPEYLQQAVVAGKRGRSAAHRTGRGAVLSSSAPALMWASVDCLTAVLCGVIAFRMRFQGTGIPSTILYHEMLLQAMQQQFLLYLLSFAFCVVFFSRLHGLYAPIQHHSGLHEQRVTFESVLTAGLLFCGFLYLTHGESISRVVVLLTVAFTQVALSIRRAAWRRMVYSRYREGLEVRNVLIIGTGRVAQALRNHLETLQHFGFRFKGFVSLTPQDALNSNQEVVGDLRNIVPLARSLFVDEVFFSVPAERSIVIGVVEEARSAGIDVRVVPDLYDGLAWNAPVEYIGQFPTIPLHRREFPVGAFMAKRILDLVISTLALTLLSPLMLLIAIMVRLDSKGPIFYRAERIGRKGRKFGCFKFRTMVPNADELKKKLAHMNERDGILFKIKQDPRITRVGRILRKYSLDELPQLWNVLRGDMSLVGPRPPLAAEVERYDISHLRRLDVLPGITGLWQVEARQDPSFDNYISLDTAYVENWTFGLDLKILIRTISVVFTGTGT
ncbi:sugar transferase [Terriglobus albidus]|uniref:Sugar transferase n=1 Tax=Terriglobus albidus TaxID=1592106 RepID=A0A5B9ECQ7_9BACT|nr:sugar transferase [Terriglobus albidus]QEE29489.1 sugar transferase [Terriglobus albidus]